MGSEPTLRTRTGVSGLEKSCWGFPVASRPGRAAAPWQLQARAMVLLGVFPGST